MLLPSACTPKQCTKPPKCCCCCCCALITAPATASPCRGSSILSEIELSNKKQNISQFINKTPQQSQHRLMAACDLSLPNKRLRFNKRLRLRAAPLRLGNDDQRCGGIRFAQRRGRVRFQPLGALLSWQFSHCKHHNRTNHLLSAETQVPPTAKEFGIR